MRCDGQAPLFMEPLKIALHCMVATIAQFSSFGMMMDSDYLPNRLLLMATIAIAPRECYTITAMPSEEVKAAFILTPPDVANPQVLAQDLVHRPYVFTLSVHIVRLRPFINLKALYRTTIQ